MASSVMVVIFWLRRRRERYGCAFSSEIGSARVDRRTLLNRGNRTRSRCGYPQRERVVVYRARRRRAAITDLDVIAAGISLSISELCTGCLQLPSGVEYQARSPSWRGDCGEVGAGNVRHVEPHHLVLEHGVPGHHAAVP